MTFEAPAGTPRPWGQPVLVGVLGGMGPYAALQFMRNVLDLTPARKDWEHVRMVLDNNCHVPSRTRAILHGEASPLPGMIDTCRRLQSWPVDVIAVPCNSACHWHAELQRVIKTPILNIVSISARAALAHPGVRRVAALGGWVPHRTALYRGPIEAAGGEFVPLQDADQERVAAHIEAVKSEGDAGAAENAAFRELVGSLAERYRLDAVVLACTEFSFYDASALPVPAVDSSTALARAVVDFAVHGKPLPLDTAEVRRFWDERADMIRSRKAGLLQSTMLTATEEEAAQNLARERDALLSAVGPLIEGSGPLLELGCGTGRWSRILAPLVSRIVAYDQSQKLLEVAAEETRAAGIDNVEFRAASVDAIEAGEPFDNVISIALLHYLDEPQFRAAMALIRASVRPGGHAIFRETFGTERRFELHGFHSDVLGAAYHAVYRRPAELAALLGDGFEVVHDALTKPPAEGRPETCQRLLIFRRTR